MPPIPGSCTSTQPIPLPMAPGLIKRVGQPCPPRFPPPRHLLEGAEETAPTAAAATLAATPAAPPPAATSAPPPTATSALLLPPQWRPKRQPKCWKLRVARRCRSLVEVASPSATGLGFESDSFVEVEDPEQRQRMHVEHPRCYSTTLLFCSLLLS